LKTIHTRSTEHKRRFAFVVSASLTLLIFGVWSFVTFPTFKDSGIVVNQNKIILNADDSIASKQNVAPFDNLKSGLASSFQALKGQFVNLKEGVEKIEETNEYEKIKDQALFTDTNGQ